MRFGLIGLAACGKTTVFNAATGLARPVGGFHAGAALEVATAHVPDPRLEALAAALKPKKVTHALLDWVDVTGLISGEGRTDVDPEVMGRVRQLDGLGIVLRAFESDSVAHPKGSVDPARDLDIVRTELVVADLAVAEGRRRKLSADIDRGRAGREEGEKEIAVLDGIIAALGEGKAVRDVAMSPEDERLTRGFQFLTKKPEITIVNSGDEGVHKGAPPEAVAVRGKLEAELCELPEPERAEFAKECGVTEPASRRLTGRPS